MAIDLTPIHEFHYPGKPVMTATISVISQKATEILKSLPEGFFYHNLAHTQEVVKSVQRIAQASGFSSAEKEILVLAAWLHDVGFAESYPDHVKESQKIAYDLLTECAYPLCNIRKVIACIGATRMPQAPNNHLEKALCDADLSHLASPQFFRYNCALRAEWEHVLGKMYSDEEWATCTSSFLNTHTYWTAYGKKVLDKGKQHAKTCYLEFMQLFPSFRGHS